MISIVVPAFNEEHGIEELHRRITQASIGWGEPMELIIVDDGSRDNTLPILSSLAARDPNLKVVCLSRNFGHQAAVSAGLQHTSGDIVCVMDADLQDPPEELLPFIERIREGFDVVYAIRTKRKEGLLKRIAYKAYYRILRQLATLDIPIDAGDFCVMRSHVVQSINDLPERNRFVRGLRTWVGFRQTGQEYERSARFAGETKYTFSRLLKLALDGIINFSYRPLQMITIAGLLVAFMACLLGVVVLILFFTNTQIAGYTANEARGWTSLVLILLFTSAVQLISLGIMGEYLGRLYEETKGRPIFVVKKRINFPN